MEIGDENPIYNVSQNISAFYIFNNSAKNKRMLIIFGAENLEEISHQKIMNSLNSPE